MYEFEKEYLELKGYKSVDGLIFDEEICYVCQSTQTTYEGLSTVNGGYLHTTEILPRSRWCNKIHPTLSEFNLIQKIEFIIG